MHTPSCAALATTVALFAAACGSPSAPADGSIPTDANADTARNDAASPDAFDARPDAPPPTDASPDAPIVPPSNRCTGARFFIAPGGSDSNSGRDAASPFHSFRAAFAAVRPGDTLVLLDGAYSDAAGTGYLSDDSAAGGHIPSGVDAAHMTCVIAQNAGTVRVTGDLALGTQTRKDHDIDVEGIAFEGHAELYNTDHVMVRRSGFHATDDQEAVVDVGSNDGEWGNTYDLFEDVWIWGNARVGLIVYRSDHVVVRRAVVRNDGCLSSSDDCGSNGGNSMVGTTVYNSHHISLQNVVVVDSVLGPAGFGGASDIQTAWHDNFIYPFGANEWLGVISLGSQYGGMYPEVDDIPGATAFQPLFTYRDVIIAGAPSGVSAQSSGSSARKDLVIVGATVVGNSTDDDVFRVGPEYDPSVSPGGLIQNVIALGPGRFGMNSAIAPSFVDVAGNFTQGDYNQTSCQTGCLTSDPRSDGAQPSLKYLPRIEAGSLLHGAGANGVDLGANVETRYGADGTFYDEQGFDARTATPLWPWPAQDLIRAEMCTRPGETRGFCAKPSLSHYVWEYLGNPCPAGVCG